MFLHRCKWMNKEWNVFQQHFYIPEILWKHIFLVLEYITNSAVLLNTVLIRCRVSPGITCTRRKGLVVLQNTGLIRCRVSPGITCTRRKGLVVLQNTVLIRCWVSPGITCTRRKGLVVLQNTVLIRCRVSPGITCIRWKVWLCYRIQY